MVTRWRTGEAELTLTIAPRDCIDQPSVRGWELALIASSEFTAKCPKKFFAISQMIKPIGSYRPTHDGGGHGTLLRTVGGVCFSLALVTLLLLLIRMMKRRLWPNPRWFALALATFALALGVRYSVAPSLANWYTQVLGAEGVAFGRFGSGIFLVQELLRALIPWSDTAWLNVNIWVGALAIPLAVAMAAQLRLTLTAAAALGVFFALTPYHVRITASPSEHVLASTLLLAGLWLWLRALNRQDRLCGVAAFALAACAVLIRVDMVFQAAAIPVVGLLMGHGRHTPLRRADWGGAAGFGVALGVLAAGVYMLVVLPSEHPTPQWQDIQVMLTRFIGQYPELALNEPHWLSPVALFLAGLGAVYAAWHRRYLLASVVLFLFLAFVPMGRPLGGGEIMSARYFLATLPIYLVLTAIGFEQTLVWLGRVPWAPKLLTRTPWSTLFCALALCAVAGVSTYWVSAAYERRFTFQDEYDFLRTHLAHLPDDCTVYQMSVRSRAYGQDLDCCLWARNSPLALAYPKLRFAELDPIGPLPTPAPGACAAYYEGAMCAMQETAQTKSRFKLAKEITTEQCETIRGQAALTPLARGEVSAYVPSKIYGGVRPKVTLYRWK
jgi:hypothetical protein